MSAVHWVEETSSTQTDLVARALDGGLVHGYALAARRQTAGRGRRGRTWEAPAGSCLTMSMLLRPNIPLKQLPLVTLAVAVAIREASGVGGIKWPNDLLDDSRRKFAGILAEAEVFKGYLQHVVVGIGVNLTASPPNVPESTHLAALGVHWSQDEAAEKVREAVLRSVDTLVQEPHTLLCRWRELSCTLGQQVRVGEVAGKAVDVSEDGALLIDPGDGRVQRVHAGDVQMVSIRSSG